MSKPFHLTLAVAFLLCATLALAQVYPDLPPPSGEQRPTNMLAFSVGSLIIDMGDRQIENTYVADQTLQGEFNLKVYGYAVRLLHSNIPLYWAIAANKPKDGVDFIAQSHRILPTANYSSAGPGVWGSTQSQLNSFRGGPLIVSSNFASSALSVLNDWIAEQGSTPGMAKSIVIYELDQNMDIDIRHTLLHKPFLFVSAASGDPFNFMVQPNILAYAGLIEGPLGVGHYEVINDTTQIELFDASTCYTMFSEPHIIYDISNSSYCPRCIPSVPKYRSALFKFIESGGNFAAQCAGVASYENSLWASQYKPEPGVEGAFFSTVGIFGLGNSGNEWGSGLDANNPSVADQSIIYPHPDLPAVQFVGSLSGHEPGTLAEFFVLGDYSKPETNYIKNFGHSLAENSLRGAAYMKYANGDGTQNLNITLPQSRTAFVVTGAKIGNYSLGGMVYYIGGHSWWQPLLGTTPRNANSPTGYNDYSALMNGRRLFMNLVLTPSTRPANCLLSLCPNNFTCPSAPYLGTCQTCECIDNQQKVIDDPSLCGTCELCQNGNCEVDASLCTSCEECLPDSSSGHWNCQPLTTPNCTGDGGLTPAQKGAIAGGVIGGVIGGLLGAGALAAAGVIAWKLLKKPPPPPEAPAELTFDGTDGVAHDNVTWVDPVKTFESGLATAHNGV
jgi:hypothetical protein